MSTSFHAPKLSPLEKRGLASLLGETVELLRPEFDGVIGNGSSCRICGAHGFGTPAPHTMGCRGVAMLHELREVEAHLQGKVPLTTADSEAA